MEKTVKVCREHVLWALLRNRNYMIVDRECVVCEAEYRGIDLDREDGA